MSATFRRARSGLYIPRAAGGGSGSATAWESAVLADSTNLWGAWKTRETSGTTLADFSGNSRPMTITGSPTLAQVGPDGSTLDAISWPSSASSEHYAATSAGLGGTAGDIATLECLVYLTATPTGTTPLLGFSAGYGNGTYDKVLFIDTAGKPNFYCYTGFTNQITGSTALSLNAWHHLIGSIGSAGMKLRVDKVTVGSNASTGAFIGNQFAFFHGGGTGGALDMTNGSAVKLGPGAIWINTQLTDTRTDAHAAAFGF